MPKTKKRDTEQPAKVSKKSKKTSISDSVEHARAKEMLSLVSVLDKAAGINAIAFGDEERMSSGLLTLDLMLGGGICPAMITFLGPEQSSKTTLAIQILAASVGQDVPLRVHFDAEGSTSSSMDYVANVFDRVAVKGATPELVFGVRGKDGSWDQPPLIHLKDDYEGAKVFKWIHKLQKMLPDKRYEDGRWWYVYDDSKDVNKAKERMAKAGHVIDRKMTANNAGLWAPAENGGLQALVLVDSWVSLVPPSDDEEDGDNSIALQARFFSKQLPRVVGALRAKRIALVGINQLRISPLVRYGNPETEPGGHALRFWSSVRLKLFPNALSTAPYNPKPGDKDLKNFEVEDDVNGDGASLYRYIKVTTIKNKLSLPTHKAWLRLWVQDGQGEARGYCPVFDTWEYLVQTGQVIGSRSKMRLHLDGQEPAKKVLDWHQFKTLILGDAEQRKKTADYCGLAIKNLRRGCFKQLAAGRGKELLVQRLKLERVKVKAKSEEEENVEATVEDDDE